MQMGMPDLVDAARHGDREAFEALVRAGSGRLYAVAYRILRDADLANDALQEALVEYWDTCPHCATPTATTPGPTGSPAGPAIASRSASGARS